jgi:hypothetical protein
MQPYPCATTAVTPAGRTALCPLRSILGAIGHLDKTKDLSAFPAGQDEPRSASRPNRGSRAEGSLSAGKSKLFLQRDAPYHAYHAYHAPFPSARRPYHAYHAYHAPFPSAQRTLPRIPRISRTISVGLLKAPEIRFPNSSWRTTQVFLESPALMLCIRRPQRSGLLERV